MPRIDPHQLLKILSVLLAPNGGIKSKDEVQRIASLMFKFSKKLVSKCIYVSILKASEPDLLIMWMSAGGWDLIYNWLSDAVLAENWPLVSELVDLLLICPVDIERLKSNRCPKLIKTLSKNQNATESVQLAAAQIVKKWLDVVNDVLIKQKTTPSVDETDNQDVSPSNDTDVDNQQLPVYRIIKQDGKEVLKKVPPKDGSKQDIEFGGDVNEGDDNDVSPNKIEVEKPVKQSGLKTKKAMDDVVPKKINKMERFSDASSESSSSGSERGENSGFDQSPFIPSNKSDPTKDRRKDRLRQIRKDPDADDEDFVFEEHDEESSPIRSRRKKIESRDNKMKIKKNPVKAVKTKANNEQTAIVVQEKTRNPDISKLGRIPKKGERKAKDDSDKKTKPDTSDKLEKKTDRPSSKAKESDKDVSKSKDRIKSPEKDAKSSTSGKTDSIVKKPSEIRKAAPPPEIKRDSKKYNISVEARKVAPGESRPKTVKTYNSKFRSTGLEEELPPPAQKSLKKVVVPPLSLLEKKPIKRISPTKELQPPEKKPKAESNEVKKTSAVLEKSPVPAAATVSVPKQSPVSKTKFLQESGSFMDALNASMSSSKDSKKKKVRRLSSSKDSDKKESNQTTPPTSPNHDDKSPPVAKPNFRFYQDTLDHTEENKSEGAEEKKIVEEKSKQKEDAGDSGGEGDSNGENRSPSPETPEQKAAREANIRNEENRQNSDGLRGVLVFAKLRKGPKKKVQWKTNLTAIRHFELDESERVNVTKTFIDMKQMERIHERENFQIARKLGSVDVMEEKTRWRVLIPIDLPALPVIPGKNSNEKEIQYAREKTAVQAVYPNKRLIPDSPAEPDLEIHATTDPTIIPLDDLSGNEDSVNDFTNVPWPEPRTEIIPTPCDPIMVAGMGPNAPVPNPVMGPAGNFMGPVAGPMPAGPPGFPGPGPNQGGPGPMGPMGPGPNMGFPGYPGPGGPFGPPQPGPPNMGMMPPNDWRGPGPDMNTSGPGGPGPEMFGPGPGMGPPPGMMPPEMAFGMAGPLVPGLLGPGPPMAPGGPPFNMNQGSNQGPPNMFNGPGPFPSGNNNNAGNNGNNSFGGNNNMNNQNWNRGVDDRNDRGGSGRGGGGPWRNKRDRNDRRGGDNWRGGGRGGGNGGRDWGGSKNILCNNFARWGSCRTVNCNYRHHN